MVDAWSQERKPVIVYRESHLRGLSHCKIPFKLKMTKERLPGACLCHNRLVHAAAPRMSRFDLCAGTGLPIGLTLREAIGRLSRNRRIVKESGRPSMHAKSFGNASILPTIAGRRWLADMRGG